jgi:hypothetical protein
MGFDCAVAAGPHGGNFDRFPETRKKPLIDSSYGHLINSQVRKDKEGNMKRFMLFFTCFMLLWSMAFAQAGSIGLFSNTAGTDCNIYDQAPSLVTIYVVHVYTPGATSARFLVDDVSGGHQLTLLSYAPAYTHYGDCTISAYGLGCLIEYGNCITSPNVILTISYFGEGTTPPCSYIQITEDLTASPPGIYVMDCASPPNLLTATGGDVVINPDASCMCNIPTKTTSWGLIKVLYK